MEKFLTHTECDELISRSNSFEWKRLKEGYRYSQSILNDTNIENNIISIFEKLKGLKISTKPIIRLMKLDKGDLMPTHTFNYSQTTHDDYQKYKNTKFVITIFLNTDFGGGEYSLHGKEIKITKGAGIIHNRGNKARVHELTSGTSYMILCHIMDTKSNTFI